MVGKEVIKLGKFIDLTGQKFGRLMVIKRAENHITPGGSVKIVWLCKCDCGTEKNIEGSILKSGRTLSCGCLAREKTSIRNRKDLLGKTFGYLTVESYVKQSKYRTAIWKCKCKCGNTTNVTSTNLLSGHTKSCGCYNNELLVKMNVKRSIGKNAQKRRVYNSMKTNAKKRGIEFNLSSEEVFSLIEQPCYYCGMNKSNKINTDGYHYDEPFMYNGVDRIDSYKGYSIDNVVTCCKYCNLAKNTMTQMEFFDWIKRVSKHLQIAYSK